MPRRTKPSLIPGGGRNPGRGGGDLGSYDSGNGGTKGGTGRNLTA